VVVGIVVVVGVVGKSVVGGAVGSRDGLDVVGSNVVGFMVGVGFCVIGTGDGRGE